jgi:TPR repeat protein
MDTLTKAMRYGSSKAKDEFKRLSENKTKALSRQLFSKAMRLIYQQKYRDARAILEVCYQVGDPQAAYTLGCMYEFGLGGYTDREGAKTLYEYSYREKFRDPRQEYKLKILRMTR